MKKAIVTGANGFVGSWLVKELLSRNVDVIAVVRNYDSMLKLTMKFCDVRCVICPLEEISLLPNIISDEDIDVFYHLAWSGTSGNDRAEVNLQLKNVQATCNAVNSAFKIGCKKFVNAGSIMEYEVMQYIPKDNITPGLGNIYSTAKLTADFFAKTIAANLKVPYINAIVSNIYGEGEKSARFINSTIRKFLNNEEAAFTHGEQLYDFIYASDAAKAFYIIGEKGVPFASYYIGNPKPYPLKDFIIKIRNIVNPSIELNFGRIPFQGALLKYDEFNIQSIYDNLKFKPEVTFEQGIKKTTEWIRQTEFK